MPGTALACPIGLFGKLPSHGDFLRRDLPASFVEPFDAWLQRGLATSHARLGERWLDLFLVMPAWRFGLAAGVCGPEAVAGVLIPSVDRVGRYFPCTLAARLTGPVSPLCLHDEARAWFDAVERQAVSALEDGFALDPFLTQLEAIGAPATSAAPSPMARLAEPSERVASALAETVALPWSLWWTVGSPRVAAASVLAAGMPTPDAFTAFIDGSWSEAGVVDLGP